MKTILLLLLVLLLTPLLCACEDDSSLPTTQQPGTTVSTDIIDFSMDECTFASAVSGLRPDYLAPLEEVGRHMYIAREGTCYLSMTFTVKNNDLSGSIAIAGSEGGWPLDWTVVYRGKQLAVKGYSKSVKSGQGPVTLNPSALLDKPGGTVIEACDSPELLLLPGESVTIRAFGVLDLVPDSVYDPFEIHVTVPTASGEYEPFLYAVPARTAPSA